MNDSDTTPSPRPLTPPPSPPLIIHILSRCVTKSTRDLSVSVKQNERKKKKKRNIQTNRKLFFLFFFFVHIFLYVVPPPPSHSCPPPTPPPHPDEKNILSRCVMKRARDLSVSEKKKNEEEEIQTNPKLCFVFAEPAINLLV